MTNMKKREYRMSARADAAELTGQRIIDCMLDRLRTTPYERIRLEDVAADAGVTSQTVIRLECRVCAVGGVSRSVT